MEQAFYFWPSRQLLIGFANNNDKNNPYKKLCHRARVSAAVFTLAICLSLQATPLHATEVRVQHCKDDRYDARQQYREQRRQQRRHQNRDYRPQRATEHSPTASVKQSLQTPSRPLTAKVRVNPVQPRPAKPKLESPAMDAPQAPTPHSDNVNIRAKHKDDKSKPIVVKQLNDARNYRHHSKQIHSNTVVHFDDSGLIGYRVDNNPRVELHRPLAKNRYIKKLKSQHGDLKRVRVKHKGHKTRIVDLSHPNHTRPDTPAVQRPATIVNVTKPVAANMPVVQIPEPTRPAAIKLEAIQSNPVHSAPSIPQAILPEPVMSGPVTAEVVMPPHTIDPVDVPLEVVFQAAPLSPVVEQPLQPVVDLSTPNITVVNSRSSPSVSTKAVTTAAASTATQVPESAPRLESVSHSVTLNPLTGNVTTSINGQSNNLVVSIAQPILGRPDPNQPVSSSLNIGNGSSSPALTQPALPETVFNTRIAQAGESINDEQDSLGDQELPYHQVAYVDVNSLSQKHYLFGSVGKGIGMKLGQCEQLENCAASIDRQQLENLQQRLESKIAVLEQQLTDNVSDSKRTKILRTLKHVRGKLAMVKQQQELSLAYATSESGSTDEQVSEEATADSDSDTDVKNTEATESYNVSEFDTSLFEDIADVIADD